MRALLELKLASPLDRIVIAEPLLNLFPLSGKQDSLPPHHSGTLAVLGHDVGTIVEHLYESILLRSFEVKRREWADRFLHCVITC